VDATVVTVTTLLDHAATTPPRPEARAALSSWLDAANASSTHTAGQRARAAVEEARERIATALGCSPHEVVFTSGGTEADNLALKGTVWAARDRGRHRPHVVTTAVEHPAVLETVTWLVERGEATATIVPPDGDGTVSVDRILGALTDDTVLVSVMAANNELGSVNDLAALGAALADRPVALHSDAVQAIATLDVDVDTWRVDALAVSAHKIGGPQGVGVAVLRRGMPVVPLLHGGGQDRGVRSGTFAVGLDAACGAGIHAAVADRPRLRQRLRALTDQLAAGLLALDGVRRNGPADPARRLASHLHVSLDGVDPTALSLALDRAGLAASSGAACGAGAAKASHVLEACGITGTPLRLSLGWPSTEADVDRALDVLTDVVPALRSGAPVLRSGPAAVPTSPPAVPVSPPAVPTSAPAPPTPVPDGGS
jgi:cysteine desulfurase